MAIDKTNYESFLIDYLDGNLGPIEVAELILFLENHPEIKSEFSEIENLGLAQISILEFPDKSSLKKELSNKALLNDSITYSLIRQLEGDLNAEEEKELSALILTNPSIEKENRLVQNTKLQADLNISFPNKDSLKRTLVIPLYRRFAAVAAILLLLVSLPQLVYLFDPTTTTPVASQIELNPKSRLPEFEAEKAPRITANSAGSINGMSKGLSFKNKDKAKSQINSSQNLVQENLLIPAIPIEKSLSATEDINRDTIKTQAVFPNENSTALIELSEGSKPLEEQHYLSWQEIAENKIRTYSKENLTQEGNQLNTKKRLNGWEIAAVGAKLVSKLSGKKIQLKNKYDEHGDLKAFAILSSNFEFSRSR